MQSVVSHQGNLCEAGIGWGGPRHIEGVYKTHSSADTLKREKFQLMLLPRTLQR